MKEICGSKDKSLCAKTVVKGPIEITHGTYNPQSVGGFRPNEGDTHANNVLIVCCNEK